VETQIKWTDRSVTSLHHIYDFIAADSEIYAARFIQSLITATEKQLKQQPLSGRPVPEFTKTQLDFLREIVYRGYRIIYNPQRQPKEVSIITVISGRWIYSGTSARDGILKNDL
jgi:toxin ParE1/3/4